MEDSIDLKMPMVSRMADGLIGSEIIKLAGEVKKRIAAGEHIYNLTIGDFDPKIFPIPNGLTEAIITAYRNKQTNYPMANGMAVLREQVSHYLKKFGDLSYSADQILISGGARPLIYATYRALIDPGDVVIYPVPSWNNNHYSHLNTANTVQITTTPEHNFMPTADQIARDISDATLVAVCSPLNPTGTTFTKRDLLEICELILQENRRRAGDRKPVYLLYDQIYWMLTYGETEHFHPVKLLPEMRDFTISIDGISKAMAATGVRVGWTFGPDHVIQKMKSILSHMGAWSPKAEQMATADYLSDLGQVEADMAGFKEEIKFRLKGFYEGIKAMTADGLPIEAIAPQAAIYLTVKIDLVGKTLPDGSVINSVEETTAYILNEAKVALVPFYAFGAERSSPWYRLSVGTISKEDVPKAIDNIRKALTQLR